MKRSVLLTFGIFLILSCSSSSDRSDVADKTQVLNNANNSTKPYNLPQANDEFFIKEKIFEFKSEDEECSIQQKYPVIEYKNDSKVESMINKLIEDSFQITRYYSTPKDELCSDGFSISDYSTFIYNKQLLCITFENHFFGEGAGHGYGNTEVLNIDLETGRRISHQMLFKDRNLDKLRKRLFIEAKKQIDSLKYDSTLISFPSEINLSNCSFSKQGTFFYTRTGDGAIQEINVFLPYDTLKSYLNDKYILGNTDKRSKNKTLSN